MPKEENKTKVEARTPRGLADREAGELAATGRMLDVIREVYELYGFEALETPAIEYTDALGKFLPDQDGPNEGVFPFRTTTSNGLSLRYDHRAAGAFRRAELRPAAKALSILPRWPCLPE